MKYPGIFSFALVLTCALFCAACGGSGKTTLLPLPGADGGTPPAPSGLARGDLVAFTAGQKTFVMAYVNDGTEITFPTGLDDTGTAAMSGDFFIGQAEATSGLFVTVYQWAYDNGKFSDTETDHNGIDSTTAKYGGKQLINLTGSPTVDYSGGVFTVAADSANKPVTNVTWYGAVMFCNWLTEMTDGNVNNVVYGGIDTTWDHAETVADTAKSGFRLPTGNEWQFAARYRGTTAPGAGDLATEYVAQGIRGSASLTAGYYWTPGDYASGAAADSTHETETRAVSWYKSVVGEAPKDAGLKDFNGLNIYDMSGNVWEWCFTQYDADNRILVGGGIHENANGMTIGDGTNDGPDDQFISIGFRIAKNR